MPVSYRFVIRLAENGDAVYSFDRRCGVGQRNALALFWELPQKRMVVVGAIVDDVDSLELCETNQRGSQRAKFVTKRCIELGSSAGSRLALSS